MVDQSGIWTLPFGAFATALALGWLWLRFYASSKEKDSVEKSPEAWREPKPKRPKEEPKKPKKPKVIIDIKDYALEAILSALLGLYAAFVFWDVWSIGVKGLGFNATIFIYALTALLVVTRAKERPLSFRDLTWIAPSLVIGLSFSLYENDFFEPINCFIFPALLIGNFVLSSDHFWDRFLGSSQVFTDVLARIAFALFGSLAPVWRAYLRFVTNSSRLTRSQAIKITEGVALLVGIFIVVLPLLYSSDRIFAFLVEHLRVWFGDLFLENLSIFIKLPYAGLVTVLLLGICIRSKAQTLPVAGPTPKALDAIISGIVLSGLLTLYLAYLFAQFEQLWNKTFSFAPTDISSLADTGVWQLFIISIINVVGFHLLRRRTNRVIRILLPALAVVSVLVLGPTIYKTYLYISWSGLNYETFYVSVLILFFVVLLIVLCFESFRKKQSDVVKKTVLVFSIMYSAVAIFPVSQLAYAVNINVAVWPQEDMRIRIRGLYADELLSSAVAKVAKEAENLKDLKSLLKIIHDVDPKEVKPTHWCVQVTEASGETRLKIDRSCFTDPARPLKQSRVWVVDRQDLHKWNAATKSDFAKYFWIPYLHFESLNDNCVEKLETVDEELVISVKEQIHRSQHHYKFLSNSRYVGESSEYCLTESQIVSHISPEGCRVLRGTDFQMIQMQGAKSDPVLVPGKSCRGASIGVTKHHLLRNLSMPLLPRLDEREFSMLWHQKSIEAFWIERQREVFRKKRITARLEVIEKFSQIESEQRKARSDWRNEIKAIGPQSVFTKVIE